MLHVNKAPRMKYLKMLDWRIKGDYDICTPTTIARNGRKNCHLYAFESFAFCLGFLEIISSQTANFQVLSSNICLALLQGQSLKLLTS